MLVCSVFKAAAEYFWRYAGMSRGIVNLAYDDCELSPTWCSGF